MHIHEAAAITIMKWHVMYSQNYEIYFKKSDPHAWGILSFALLASLMKNMKNVLIIFKYAHGFLQGHIYLRLECTHIN